MEIIKCPGIFKKGYPLYLSDDKVFSDLFSVIPSSQKKFIIYDLKVKKLFPQFFKKLQNCSFSQKAYFFPICATEENKSFENLSKLLKKIFNLTPSKDDVVIVIGGGLVLNFGGLLASLIMRGIKSIYIPTTLTAQIDACIGSKLGVNFHGAKNWIGIYNDPNCCYINPSFFVSTLEEKEFKSQLIEAIKLSIVLDKKIFTNLFNKLDRLYKDRFELIYSFVKDMLILKIKIIKKDLREEDEGMSLLYGHTVGHAVEMLSGGKLNHGESVGIGMICEAKISNYLGFCKEDFVNLHKKILLDLGLQTEIPRFIKAEKILEKIKYNKKNYHGNPRFILLKNIGIMAKNKENTYFHEVPKAIIEKVLEQY